MKSTLLSKIVAAALFVASANCAFGQSLRQGQMMAKHYMNARANGKKMKSYLSYDIGYHIPISKATFKHSFVNEVDGMYAGEKVISREIDVKGFGVSGNVYYPLFSLTEKSILAFNVGAIGNILKYDIGEVRTSTTAVYNWSFSSMQIGLPLCIDYKFGGEAIYDKAEKVSFTAGFGISPTVYASSFGPSSIVKFGVRPYVHAEIGFFAAIEWKVRASCLMNSTQFFRADNENAGLESMPYNSRFTMNSKPVFNIGFAFMPFSWDWENSRW